MFCPQCSTLRRAVDFARRQLFFRLRGGEKKHLIVPKGGLLDQVWWDGQSSISLLEKMQIHQELSLLAEITEQKAVRMSPYWKSEYEKYLRRLRKPNQAIVVIARKLLVAVWHVLSKEETDIRVSEEELAYKMLLLSWCLNENVRKGLSYKEFAKYALMKLGVENDITRLERRGVPRRLARKAEVLARMAELELTF